MGSAIKEIQFKDANGKLTSLQNFKGKAFLIVNVASECGLTPQYEALQNLYEKFNGAGLEILAFPANEFGGQEPGTNEEIQNFCSTKYHVTFPVNEKIVVKGTGQHPLYKTLTEAKKNAVQNADGKFEGILKKNGLLSGAPHDIKWNFEKFILNADYQVVDRFYPDIKPDDPKIVACIEGLLRQS